MSARVLEPVNTFGLGIDFDVSGSAASGPDDERDPLDETTPNPSDADADDEDTEYLLAQGDTVDMAEATKPPSPDLIGDVTLSDNPEDALDLSIESPKQNDVGVGISDVLTTLKRAMNSFKVFGKLESLRSNRRKFDALMSLRTAFVNTEEFLKPLKKALFGLSQSDQEHCLDAEGRISTLKQNGIEVKSSKKHSPVPEEVAQVLIARRNGLIRHSHEHVKTLKALPKDEKNQQSERVINALKDNEVWAKEFSQVLCEKRQAEIRARSIAKQVSLLPQIPYKQLPPYPMMAKIISTYRLGFKEDAFQYIEDLQHLSKVKKEAHSKIVIDALGAGEIWAKEFSKILGEAYTIHHQPPAPTI